MSLPSVRGDAVNRPAPAGPARRGQKLAAESTADTTRVCRYHKGCTGKARCHDDSGEFGAHGGREVMLELPPRPGPASRTTTGRQW